MKTENSQHNDEQLLLKKEILCRRQLEEIKKIRQTIKGASEEYYRILQNKLENKLAEICREVDKKISLEGIQI